jgi:uroporphyrinogen III methyltransferase/synthase
VVAAYRTVQARPEKNLVDALATAGADLVALMSASAARGFIELTARIRGRSVPSDVVCASIGPETTKAAAAHGLEVAVEAETHTVAGLVEAIVSYFQRAEQNRRQR